MNYHTELPITLKDGTIVPKGANVIEWNYNDRPTLMKIQGPTRDLIVRVRSGFKAPSMRTIEKWIIDGVAETVMGDTIEVDGQDHMGVPSWPMALGMV